jgi:energy-coupling factor transporter transmembrane protein EcfT
MRAIMSVDPRVKLFLFVITCMFAVSCTKILPNFLLGTFVFLLLILNGKSGFAWKSYGVFLVALFAAENLHNVLPGMAGVVIMALCVLFRIMVPVIMAFTLVFKTTTMSQFMAAFQKMHVSAKIIIPFAVMFRFIPTVQEEWNSVRKAMAFRGIDLKAGGIIRHPMISIEYVLIPFLFSATSVMEELAAASLARGLDSERERTCLNEVKMTCFDYIFFIIALGFGAIWIMSYVR